MPGGDALSSKNEGKSPYISRGKGKNPLRKGEPPRFSGKNQFRKKASRDEAGEEEKETPREKLRRGKKRES